MDDERLRCEQLYRAHADRVHAYARRRSDDETADEVVSEVFLIAWRRLDDVPSQALPLLLGVARRTLANHRRATRRAVALQARIGAALEPARGDGGEEHAVLSALATLEPGEREVLLLVAWEGLDHGEVATVLGVNRAAVAARLYRARRRLARALSEHDEPALGRREGWG